MKTIPNNNYEEKIDKSNFSNINLQKELENYKKENEQLKNRINIMEKNITQIFEINKNLTKTIKILQSEIKDKTLIINDLKEKYAIIQKTIESFSLINTSINEKKNNSKIITLPNFNSKTIQSNNKINKISTIKTIKTNILEKSLILDKKKIKLSCKFIGLNKKIKTFKKEYIKKNIPIKYKIDLINDGNEFMVWPNDIFIRCINDDSDIYFKPSKKIHEKITENHTLYVYYEVDIYFKNYLKIEKGKYLIYYELISDSQGKIGNETGYSQIEII